MENKKKMYDLVSKDDILTYVAILATVSFVISTIVTVWFFIKNVIFLIL